MQAPKLCAAAGAVDRAVPAAARLAAVRIVHRLGTCRIRFAPGRVAEVGGITYLALWLETQGQRLAFSVTLTICSRAFRPLHRNQGGSRLLRDIFGGRPTVPLRRAHRQ